MKPISTPVVSTAGVAPASALQGLPFLRLGFRPFYLGAAFVACLTVPLWIASMLGWLALDLPVAPLLWHAHEMLFGFAATVIIGFLLTAVKAWTGLSTPRGALLGALALLWLAARVAAVVAPYAVYAALDMVLLPVVAGILLVNYHWSFAVVTFLTIASYIGFTLGVTEWRMVFRRSMNELDSQANSKAIDALLNYETVKYFGNERYEVARYDGNLASWERSAVRNQTSLNFLNAGQGVIIAVGVTVLVGLAARGVVDGSMSVGDMVLVNAYLIQLYAPLNFLGFVYREIKHSLADMERMFTLLEQGEEVADRPGAQTLATRQAAIRFEQVQFGYDGKRQILHDVSFDIPAGKTVAVVGASGAGKSTLSRLLFRFYDVGAGRITLNGVDIRELTQASLRAHIGIVPQDTVLFNDSIYYNIAYGRPDASREQVIEAARAAHIHDFVSQLPDGYDTVVGERGLKLSGGEKQRVAIARTLLKNPPILIFDEATSALDSHTEKAIQAELAEIAAQRTTLIIAHRLSTVVDAHQIVVMEGGRIIEQGSFRDLLDRQGRFAQMWQLQLQDADHA